MRKTIVLDVSPLYVFVPIQGIVSTRAFDSTAIGFKPYRILSLTTGALLVFIKFFYSYSLIHYRSLYSSLFLLVTPICTEFCDKSAADTIGFVIIPFGTVCFIAHFLTVHFFEPFTINNVFSNLFSYLQFNKYKKFLIS